jgi:hypothetical protein
VSDTDLIRDIVRAQAEAWNRGDANGYAANAGEDLAFTNIRGQRWIGREHFVRVHTSVLNGVYPPMQTVDCARGCSRFSSGGTMYGRSWPVTTPRSSPRQNAPKGNPAF